MSDHPPHEEFLPNVQSKPPYAQVEARNILLCFPKVKNKCLIHSPLFLVFLLFVSLKLVCQSLKNKILFFHYYFSLLYTCAVLVHGEE